MPKSDQGISGGRYQVIPRTLIFVVRDNLVLLLKGAPTKRLWANRYNGVGGHVERGEDVLAAAKRELLEETGLVAQNLRLCGTLLVDASDLTGIMIFIFRGDYAGGDVLSSDEGTLEWVEIDKVKDLPQVEDLPIVLNRVISVRSGDAPFHARSYYNDQEQLILIINE